MGAGGKSEGGGIEQKEKRIYGHGQQCGDCWEEKCIRGLNGNREKYNKNYLFLKKEIPIYLVSVFQIDIS